MVKEYQDWKAEHPVEAAARVKQKRAVCARNVMHLLSTEQIESIFDPPRRQPEPPAFVKRIQERRARLRQVTLQELEEAEEAEEARAKEARTKEAEEAIPERFIALQKNVLF